MAAIFGTLIRYPAHIDSHRGFILHILMYPFFTYIHKMNTTVTYYLQFMSIFLNFIYSTSPLKAFKLHVLWHKGHLRLSCVFLAHYAPKCQMSSAPYGPIFRAKNVSCLELKTLKNCVLHRFSLFTIQNTTQICILIF